MKAEDYQVHQVSDRLKKLCHVVNNLLTSLAWDCTGEYWPFMVFVRPSRSVSKRLVSANVLALSKRKRSAGRTEFVAVT